MAAAQRARGGASPRPQGNRPWLSVAGHASAHAEARAAGRRRHDLRAPTPAARTAARVATTAAPAAVVERSITITSPITEFTPHGRRGDASGGGAAPMYQSSDALPVDSDGLLPRVAAQAARLGRREAELTSNGGYGFGAGSELMDSSLVSDAGSMGSTTAAARARERYAFAGESEARRAAYTVSVTGGFRTTLAAAAAALDAPVRAAAAAPRCPAPPRAAAAAAAQHTDSRDVAALTPSHAVPAPPPAGVVGDDGRAPTVAARPRAAAARGAC